MHSVFCQTKLASHDTAAAVVNDEAGEPNQFSCPDSNEADSALDEKDFETAGNSQAEDPDEAVILALIGEQIYKYRLHPDKTTDCAGYNYTDSTQADYVPWDEDDAQILEQAEESVKYIVLCAERVSQMTKTYNDIEAVTRLLEEKERDLELTARIGQTLLSKNKELSNRVEGLEDELTLATDRVHQLRHDLCMKDELLKYYNEDLELEVRRKTASEAGLDQINVDFLETKVKLLEDENLHLRLESAQLKSETDSYEEKEKKLVENCIQQLAEVNLQVESFAEELHQKAEENIHHKEEVTKLLLQLTDLQKKIRKLTVDNMDIREKLTASTESQRKLTQELVVMQDKHDELLEMLEEAHDELRVMKSKDKVHSRNQHDHSGYSDSNSLASELETSLQQELSQSGRRSDSWKVFETARAARQAAAKAAHKEASSGTRMSLASPYQLHNDSHGTIAYTSDVESLASDNCSVDMDCFYESNPELGRPGIPGSGDLDSALKRLALRRANEENEKYFHEEEMERRRNTLQTDMHDGASQYSHNHQGSPLFRSPADSMSSRWNSPLMSVYNQHFKLPDKLQIVKPMEGSMTLRHWQHLATPHLGGIFEERHGVQMKGGSKQGTAEDIYSLSNPEEDDHTQDVHTRKEQDMNLTYTFTNSTVRNPGNYGAQGALFDTCMSSSTLHADTSVTTDPQQSSTNSEPQLPQTPHKLSVDSTQGSYRLSLGLAALLQGTSDHVGRALLRVSASKPATDTTNLQPTPAVPIPNSDLNQKFFTSQSFDSQPLSSSVQKILLGSKSFDQATMKKDDKMSFGLQKKSEQFTAEMKGQGFLQQLKSKGYSLYGLLGGGGKNDQAHEDSSADEMCVIENDSIASTKVTVAGFSSDGASVGVLSAMTDLRRSGLL